MGRDGYTGLVVLAASLVLFWATLGLERHPMVPVGPAFYPRIVLGVTALMAVMLVVFDVWRARKSGSGRSLPSSAVVGGRSDEAMQRVAPAKAAARVRPNYALVASAFAVFTAYVVMLPYLGFRPATLLFLLAMQVTLEWPRARRRWVAVGLIAIVATFAIHYVFEQYLHVLLPRGRWTDF